MSLSTHIPSPYTHSRRTLSRCAALAMLIAVVAAALLQVHTPAAHAASAHELRVIVHNIAGGPTFRGSPDAIAGVNAQIEAFHPDVVMMAEVCASQRDAFQEAHPDWHVYFSVMVSNQRSCKVDGNDNIRQGQLLASPYPISNITNDLLGHPDVDAYPDGEKRTKNFKLLCGDVAIPGHSATGLRACVTHLRAFQDPEDHTAREAQTAKIRSLLHDRIWTDGQAVTVGGDFNALPNWNAMTNMYRLTKDSQYTGIGDFYEADQTDAKWFGNAGPSVTCGEKACRSGERTLGASSKYDYAFISRNVTHGGRVSALAADKYGSDHHLYRALFEIQY